METLPDSRLTSVGRILDRVLYSHTVAWIVAGIAWLTIMEFQGQSVWNLANVLIVLVCLVLAIPVEPGDDRLFDDVVYHPTWGWLVATCGWLLLAGFVTPDWCVVDVLIAEACALIGIQTFFYETIS